MPRNLFSKQSDDEKSLNLTKSPESQSSTGTGRGLLHELGLVKSQLRSKGANITARNDLHPYVQTLSLADLDSCVALETAAFPEAERCSRENYIYRLSTCPELCLGLFSTTQPDTPASSLPTYASARPPNSAFPSRKGVLIAHVIATKRESPVVTDNAMNVGGHQEHGRTIAIHSLAVLPQYQRRNLGKTLLKAYTQRMESAGIADRIALLAHPHLSKFYEEQGFSNKGESKCKSHGGGWHDLIYEFSEHGLGS